MLTIEAWLAGLEYAPGTVRDTLRTLERAKTRLALGEPLQLHARPALVRWEAARLAGVRADPGWEVLDGALERLNDARSRLGGRRAKVRASQSQREARSFEDAAWTALLTKISACPEPAARVLEVMAGTGLRVGDVLRTTLDSLRDSGQTGQVSVVLKGGTRSSLLRDGAENAWAGLCAVCLSSTRTALGDLDVADVIAPGSKDGAAAGGAAYKRVQRLLKLLASDAGITEEVWTHRLRRTVGVQAYRQTEDMLAVRDLLHQKSVRTTEGYLSEARPDRVASLQKQVASRFAPQR